MRTQRLILSLTAVAALMLFTGCMKTYVSGVGEETYRLTRGPTYWEFHVDGDIQDVFNAAVAGCNDLDLRIYHKKADNVTGLIEGNFADMTDYAVNLYQVPSVGTRVRIHIGITAHQGRTEQLADAIVKNM